MPSFLWILCFQVPGYIYETGLGKGLQTRVRTNTGVGSAMLASLAGVPSRH